MTAFHFAIIVAVWNIIIFVMYGLDKRKAKQHGRRISEKTLLLGATFMGSLGALFGMYAFHHKTKHLKFRIGVPLLLIMNIIIVVLLMKTIPLKWS